MSKVLTFVNFQIKDNIHNETDIINILKDVLKADFNIGTIKVTKVTINIGGMENG